jgi:hypothetical protein
MSETHPVSPSNKPEPALEVWEDCFVTLAAELDQNKQEVNDSQISSERRLDQAADSLAEQGSKHEQQYDENHSLFTK